MTSYTTRSSYPYPDPSDQVADYPTTASSIAGYLDHLPNRNAIINPVMDIWQRGTSFSNPANGSYTADRWRIDYDGAGGTRTVARNTISLGTNLPSGIQGKYFMEVTLTNAGTATTQSISQRVERVNTFAGETITLSAWVRNDGAGTGVNTLTARAIQNFGTGGSPSTAVTTTLGTASVTGSWVRLHVHATLPSISGKTIGSNGDDYLEIKFDLGIQTGRFWLYGVQLEQNSTQTALERRPIQQELALCHRYFTRYAYTDGYGELPQYPWRIDTPARPAMVLMYPEKRASPVVTLSSASHFSLGSITTSATGTPSAYLGTLVGTNKRSAALYFTLAGWSQWVPCCLFPGTSSAYIDVSAEL